MKMVSHGSVNCPFMQHAQIQDKIFRMLTLTVVICEILMLGSAHGWLYYYYNQTMSWRRARAYCRQHHTDMVAIQNMKENEYLMDYLPKGKAHVWIGLRKINNTWTWIGTNRRLEDEAMNWAVGEPNNGKNTEDCVEMYIKVAANSGKWNDEPCLRKKRPLCFQASCSPDSCNGHGECVETIGSLKCVCYEGFYGELCEKVLKCLRLETPDRAIMNCSHPYGNFSYNSTCDFSCVEGFQIREARRLQCTASAEWTAPVPNCTAIRCRGLEVSRKDVMTCSHPFGKFSYNSTCTFGCREGYVVDGAERIQCLASGQWTESLPTCKVQQCETLVVPEHGNMNCSHPFKDFRYNSTCDISCSEGFSLNGLSRLQCEISGQWSAQKPTCEAVKCSELKVPPNLLMNCSDPFRHFSYSSTCDFFCEDGFTLQGSDRLQCEVSGQWTSKIPTCKAVQCTPLSIPEWGNMKCRNMYGDFSYNSTCVFGCTEGFVLHGSNNLQCQASRQWTAEVPTCEAAKCTTLENPEQGTINCSHPLGPFRYNATCDFSCEKGFVLNGSNTVQCGALGQWMPQIPSCKATKCDMLRSPDGGTYNCTHPIDYFSYNSSCDFSCAEGFILMGSHRLECRASGQWTAQMPTCTVVTCQTITQPERGMINCTHPIGNFSYSSTCSFDCTEGFVLQGSDVLQCEANGQWTAHTPNCKVLTCRTLMHPEQGAMNCSHPIRDFSYSSMCDFSCAEGFALRGSKRLQCQNNGLWTAQNPSCEVIICKRLMQPEQGAMNCSHPNGDFSYSSTCDFSCAEGFMLNGSDQLQCQANGQWTAQSPHCKAISCPKLINLEQGAMNCSHPNGDFSYNSTCDFSCAEGFILNGSDQLQCQANGQWTAQSPHCKAISCPKLINLEQGAMNCSHPNGDFSYNSTCDFSCAEGFILNGSDQLQCQANGQWTAQSPHCKAISCPKLINLEQGAMNCSHPNGDFSYNSTCDFSCAEGFILNGSDQLQCQANGQWTAQSPHCKAISCPKPINLEQGAMNCSHPIGDFGYSSTCDFVCAEGFNLYGSDRLQCQANGQWTAQSPNCKAVSCRMLTKPVKGAMKCSHPIGDFSYNSTCDFSCAVGFALRGSNRLQCQVNGQWTAEIPSCKAVKCNTLKIPNHGKMNCTHPFGNFSYGSKCMLGCMEGLALKGTDETECTESGNWTNELPHCEVPTQGAADFLHYVGGIAAAVVLGLIIAMTLIWIRRKMKSQVLPLHSSTSPITPLPRLVLPRRSLIQYSALGPASADRTLAEEDSKKLTSNSAEVAQDTFENPAFISNP